MVATVVPLERIDELLRFLPLFEQPGRPFVERWEGQFPVYCSDVQEFFRLAARGCWHDYEYVRSEAARILEDESLIGVATLGQIRAVLTYCVRGERFCDGSWESALQSGRIVLLLRRLKVLRTLNHG
jgi:Family of unknown function (DUF6508)